MTYLPAAECFHPDRGFFCGGLAVEGGTSDTGDAAGIRDEDASAVDMTEVEVEVEPGNQADVNEIG